MRVSALASGSSGNCFYVESHDKAVLVDAGISAKQIVERIKSVGGEPSRVKGIFVTHEHSDHIRGTDVFARAFNVPIFATKDTARSGFLCSDSDLIHTIKNNETVKIGKMEIQAFSKSHKCADPVSYNIYNDKKLSIITDVGYACKNVIENVSDSDFLFMESNYDERMLASGPYPIFLKNWIKSPQGHLSNVQSACCVLEHASPKLKNLVLSHISLNNNTPETAFKTFVDLLKERRNLKPEISVSDRSVPTEMFRI
ncbi:MAG: MBL fold metallo-hydrolase [Candidatus Pacearchaeota archaeon]|jgi:phosphoribosyl 1,2-cyclic phosphodiesterase